MANSSVTPSRQQYLDVKAQHQDAIVFFRLGDFYETFDDDAKLAAEVLDLVLTSRPQGKNQRTPWLACPTTPPTGSTLDFVTRGLSEAFEMTGNPMEAGRCGCGESFTPKA